MRRLYDHFMRLWAYLMSRPETLTAVGTGIKLPDDHTTVVLALNGWGWLFAGTPDALPRWIDWRFFVRPHAHVLVPSGQPVQILTRNLFGTHAVTWTPSVDIKRIPPHAPAAPAWPVAHPHKLPAWKGITRATPTRGTRVRVDIGHGAVRPVPEPPKVNLAPIQRAYAGQVPFASTRAHLARCSWLAESSAAAASASALTFDTDTSRSTLHNTRPTHGTASSRR
jgi:hypothetical protein